MEKKKLAKEIFNMAHLTGEFLLRSGKVSHEYFDKYQFESSPIILDAITTHMLDILPSGYDLLGAMEMGGIPIATSLSLKCGLPVVFLRKEAKTYGTSKFAEGPAIEGKKILIIEDVITTGGAVVTTTKMLRDAGAKVVEVISVIDRSGGDHSKLQGVDLKLHSLFTADELKA